MSSVAEIACICKLSKLNASHHLATDPTVATSSMTAGNFSLAVKKTNI